MNASLVNYLNPSRYDRRWESPAGRALRAVWEATPYRPIPGLPGCTDELDWTYGEFVEVAYKNVVPPTDDEHLEPVSKGSRVFDVTQRHDAQAPTLPFDFRRLIGAWPDTYAGVARQIGATETQLRAYIRGRPVLAPSSEHALMDVLGLRWEQDYPYVEVVGPCLLVGHSILAADRAYTEVSHGGDLDFAAEVIPEASDPNPEWHLIIMQTCGVYPSFLLIPRATPNLPPRWADTLINFTPEPFEIHRNEYEALIRRVLDALATPAQRKQILLQVVRDHRWLLVRMESELRDY
jgi:hypothetical protein